MKHANYWFDTCPVKNNNGVGFVKNVDVLVIGGGLAGISTLFHLVRAGVSNSYLLEEANIGYHSSGRSSGQLLLRGRYTFSELAEKFGKDVAKEYLSFSVENIRKCCAAITRSKIDADLVQSGGLHLATTQDELNLLVREAAFINEQTNVTGATALVLTETEVKSLMPSIGFIGGIYIPCEATINPYKFISGLRDLIELSGSRTLTNSCVEKVERNVDDTFSVSIRHKGTILAKKIVYCINAYTSSLLPEMENVLLPFRGQVIATDILSKQILQVMPTMSVSCNYGNDYFRTHNDRLLFGGQRQNIRGNQEGIIYDGEISQTIFKRQRDFLQQHLPFITPKFTHAWSNVMCNTKNGMPLVNELNGRKNEFILAGCNGFGLSSIYMSSLIIRDLIIKGSSNFPGSQLFSNIG